MHIFVLGEAILKQLILLETPRRDPESSDLFLMGKADGLAEVCGGKFTS
ncbi:hypothetical protein [Caldimonas sp. KR1-144]